MSDRFDDAILVDEVGIETGVCGSLRVQTMQRPVFSRIGDQLRITAVEASTLLSVGGRPLDVANGDAAVANMPAGLALALHLANHRHLPEPGSVLFLDCGGVSPQMLRDALGHAAARAAALGEPAPGVGRIICRVDAGTMHAAGGFKALGLGLAVDLFEGEAQEEQLPKPDVAEIGGRWLAKIAGETAAARLLTPLVAAHRQERVRFSIRGITSAEHLRLAVDAGADYLSGDYLAPARLAGSAIDDAAKPLAPLLRRLPPVSTLFG